MFQVLWGFGVLGRDSKEKLKEWVRSVTGSMERLAEKERRSHRGIGRFMNRIFDT